MKKINYNIWLSPLKSQPAMIVSRWEPSGAVYHSEQGESCEFRETKCLELQFT